MTPSTLEHAREFLRSRRIALVGVSRDPRDFSRLLLRELAAVVHQERLVPGAAGGARDGRLHAPRVVAPDDEDPHRQRT